MVAMVDSSAALNALTGTDFKARQKSPEVAQDAAEKYVSVFFTQLISEMMEGVEAEGGFGEEMFRPFLAEQLGTHVAQSETGADLVNAIADQMIALQEGRAGPVAPQRGQRETTDETK